MCLASLSVLAFYTEAFRLDLDLILVFVQFDLNKMDMLNPGVLCLSSPFLRGGNVDYSFVTIIPDFFTEIRGGQ